MSAVLFFIAAVGAVSGAVGVVLLRDPFYAVLSLVGHLLFLAVLFLLLRSEFVAAAQVVVYAGAVMVLYVFVVAYVGEHKPLGERRSGGGPVGSGLRLGAVVFGGALAIELLIALLGTGLHGVDTRGAPFIPGFGSPRYIGNLLLTKFLLAFEVASFLLLIAAVGAVMLARRRGGIDDEEDVITVAALLRPRGTGTLAEGVTSLAFAAAHDRPAEFMAGGRREEPVSAPAELMAGGRREEPGSAPAEVVAGGRREEPVSAPADREGRADGGGDAPARGEGGR